MADLSEMADALKHFLVYKEANKHKAKYEILKTYTVQGASFRLRFTNGQGYKKYPRLLWVNHPPKGYEDFDFNKWVREYLTPYATEPPPPKRARRKVPKVDLQKRIELEYGSRIHQTDTNYYKQLKKELMETLHGA